jgi:hypothetical protein
MNTNIESKSFPPEGSALASWYGMHLEDLCLIPIPLSIDTGSKSAHPCPDNDNGSVHG